MVLSIKWGNGGIACNFEIRCCNPYLPWFHLEYDLHVAD